MNEEQLLVPELTREGRDGALTFGGADLEAIAEKFGTPCYVYSADTVVRSYREFRAAVQPVGNGRPIICVSVKANSNLSLLSLLAKEGAGFDVVSGGELARVQAAGGLPQRVVFAGVGKRDEEIRFALQAGILFFNVESIPELERIDQIAAELKVKAPVAIRVNPDVDAKTHAHISTGKEEHKFGIPLAAAAPIYAEHGRYPHCEFVGVDCHIGSMITDLTSFAEAFGKIMRFVTEIRPQVPTLRFVDFGGGLGISYGPGTAPDVAEFGKVAAAACKSTELTAVFEPGRFIFGNAGLLLSTVLFVKEARPGAGRAEEGKRFLIVDAAFNDLIRPVLYEAYHGIVPLTASSAKGRENGRRALPYDVVGPVCETGDCFAQGRVLPELARGDRVALLSAGAYGFAMASTYNTRPTPPEVLVEGGVPRLVKPRKEVEELFADEKALLR